MSTSPTLSLLLACPKKMVRPGWFWTFGSSIPVLPTSLSSQSTGSCPWQPYGPSALVLHLTSQMPTCRYGSPHDCGALLESLWLGGFSNICGCHSGIAIAPTNSCGRCGLLSAGFRIVCTPRYYFIWTISSFSHNRRISIGRIWPFFWRSWSETGGVSIGPSASSAVIVLSTWESL